MKHHFRFPGLRKGTTFIEAILSVILMGILCGMLFPVIGRLMQVHAEVAQKRFAQCELRNLAEQVMFLQSTDEALNLPQRVQDTLTKPQLEVSRLNESDGTVRIDLTLSWESANSRPRSRVQLSCWQPGGSP